MVFRTVPATFLKDNPMPIMEDSGISVPNDAKTPLERIDHQIAYFDGWNIDAYERLHEERARLLSKSERDNMESNATGERTMQSIVDEVYSRLMQEGCSGDNEARDRIAALEGAWRVCADFARLSNGN
jgi:hypothetical protein